MDESFLDVGRGGPLSILKLLSVVAVQLEAVAVQSLSGQLFAQEFPWEVHVDSDIHFYGLGLVGLGRLLPDTAPVGCFMCKEAD